MPPFKVREGRNMTEVLAALNVLAATDSEERDIALATFYDEWKENNLGRFFRRQNPCEARKHTF